MSKEIILEQLPELKKAYPNLIVSEYHDYFDIFGDITVYVNGIIPVYDTYAIRMKISFDFPEAIPLVWETGGKLPKSYDHFLTNGSLCLAVGIEILLHLRKNASIISFINHFVVNYLYSAYCYDRFGHVTHGSRSHNSGILEAYKELMKTTSNKQTINILEYILEKSFKKGIYSTQSYRGHHQCPCGSAKKIRNCVHKELLWEFMSSEHYVLQIYFDYNKIKRR